MGTIKMFKYLSTAITSTLFVMSLNVCAASQAHPKPLASQNTPLKQVDNTTFHLYKAPNKDAKVIYKTSVTKAKLTQIFYTQKHKQWVKVGDKSNGKVGWVFLPEYNKALHAQMQPDIQSVFIQQSQSKDGKPVVQIIAYHNGKKLDEHAANQLYKQIERQNIYNQERMDHLSNQFQQELIRSFRRAQLLNNEILKADFLTQPTHVKD